MDADHGARVNDWTDIVRRARLGPTVKLVALVIASYANADGTKVFPGVARLAVQCEVDYRTVQRALAALRKAGLIEVVRRGARRAGQSDEYRLIIAADVLERIEVPTPAAERVAIERTAEPRRNRSTRHPRPVEPAREPSDHTTGVTCENGSTRQGNPVLHDTGAAPPSIDLDLEEQPPSGEINLRSNGSGSERGVGTNGDDKADVEDTRTRAGTEARRQRLSNELDRWLADHPEAATP